MTGDLVLNAAPNADMKAATKKYVDDLFASGVSWLDPILDSNLTDDSLTSPP